MTQQIHHQHSLTSKLNVFEFVINFLNLEIFDFPFFIIKVIDWDYVKDITKGQFIGTIIFLFTQ